MARRRQRLQYVLLAVTSLIAGCASPGSGPIPSQESPPPADAPPPANLRPEEFVGRWGLAAYHKEQDRPRTEAAARGQCKQPYTITRGPTGGLMMHLADAPQPEELRLKAGPGKNYIGPRGPAADQRDREIVSFDGRVMILRFVDQEIATRYGTMIYVRCGGRA